MQYCLGCAGAEPERKKPARCPDGLRCATGAKCALFHPASHLQAFKEMDKMLRLRKHFRSQRCNRSDCDYVNTNACYFYHNADKSDAWCLQCNEQGHLGSKNTGCP